MIIELTLERSAPIPDIALSSVTRVGAAMS
jgi:hypothetical protein